MNVLAFDCTPILDSSSPTLILTAFLAGMIEAGARVELHCARDLTIAPFEGDLASWLGTESRSRRRDDMAMLLPKLQQADAWVFATPVYSSGMSLSMKNLLDRMGSLTLPSLEVRGRLSQPRLCEGVQPGLLVLIASTSAWELEKFEPLVLQMNAFSASVARTFAGALFRPHSPVMTQLIELGRPVDDIFEAAFSAGAAVANGGRILDEDAATVSRQLLPLNMYLEFVNAQLPTKLSQILRGLQRLRRAGGARRKKAAAAAEAASSG